MTKTKMTEIDFLPRILHNNRSIHRVYAYLPRKILKQNLKFLNSVTTNLLQELEQTCHSENSDVGEEAKKPKIIVS
jgi:hypothetical protein